MREQTIRTVHVTRPGRPGISVCGRTGVTLVADDGPVARLAALGLRGRTCRACERWSALQRVRNADTVEWLGGAP